MIIDTVEAWQVEELDFLIIDDQECRVEAVSDEGDKIIISYTDEFGDLCHEEFPSDWTFEIWGN